MTLPNAFHGEQWWLLAAIVMLVGIPLILWSSWSRRATIPVRVGLTTLKATALALLALCLLEPVYRFTRPEPEANSLIVMADCSQSLEINDPEYKRSRGETLRGRLEDDAPWLAALDELFELHRYQFDERLSAVADFQGFHTEGSATALGESLRAVGRRLHGKPCAGVVILTDGISSEPAAAVLANLPTGLPPVFPVVVGSDQPARDLAITAVEASQTNFESAPVTIKADLIAYRLAGETVHVELLGPDEKSLEVQNVREIEDGRPFAVRFKLGVADRGVHAYQVRAFADGTSLADDSAKQYEATVANNVRSVVVDRGRGPFRILYLAGRPNWEYKFLRRAIADDEELNLVGLLRVAKKEPKFSFRGRSGESTNPLFRGFGNQGDATAEQYDEPVLIRLDTRDEVELRDGFPKDAATLFAYDAIVLDDIEADFFTEDQKTLVTQFVSQRGGGLLMLGGLESFASGAFDRTRIGEMLPVYLDAREPTSDRSEYSLRLTREGWLQPWLRMQPTRDLEEKRIAEMPVFRTLNAARSIKPGATVLATAWAQDDSHFPSLVVQQFGKGRTAALMLGDLWRWKLSTPPENHDLYKSWRQTLRWLVSDVPRRVDVQVHPMEDQGLHHRNIVVTAYDDQFKPQLNADVGLVVTTPSGKKIELTAEQNARKAGRYATSFVSREAGAHRVAARVQSPEGNLIERRETGWVSELAVDEFRSLLPNRKLLRSLAEQTGGQLLELDDLNGFAASFENRSVPKTETHTRPWWHRWSLFLAAVGLLVSEWGLRRMVGLA